MVVRARPVRAFSVSLFAAPLLAISCAHVTPYQPAGPTGGYEDARVGPTRFFVTVRGNGVTSQSTLVAYFHRRAAELCGGIGYADYAWHFETSEENYQLRPRSYTIDRDRDGDRRRTVVTENPAVMGSRYGVSGYVNCHTPSPRQPASPPTPPAYPPADRGRPAEPPASPGDVQYL